MTLMTTITALITFLSGKTETHRGCDISRAQATRIMGMNSYS